MLHDASNRDWSGCRRRFTSSEMVITISAVTDEDPAMVATSVAALARSAGAFCLAVLLIPSVHYEACSILDYWDTGERAAFSNRLRSLRSTADLCLVLPAYYKVSPQHVVRELAPVIETFSPARPSAHLFRSKGRDFTTIFRGLHRQCVLGGGLGTGGSAPGAEAVDSAFLHSGLGGTLSHRADLAMLWLAVSSDISRAQVADTVDRLRDSISRGAELGVEVTCDARMPPECVLATILAADGADSL